jgi:hypothetical protein
MNTYFQGSSFVLQLTLVHVIEMAMSSINANLDITMIDQRLDCTEAFPYHTDVNICRAFDWCGANVLDHFTVEFAYGVDTF